MFLPLAHPVAWSPAFEGDRATFFRGAGGVCETSVLHRVSNGAPGRPRGLARHMRIDPRMLYLAAALALVIGLTLGLLGGGGSILTLPVLVYVLHVDPKQAIASSLLVVGTTALASAAAHARAGNVDYRTGAMFGVAGMAGAFGGGRVAGHLPGELLLGGFAAVMLVTAIAMMRPRREPAAGEVRRASPVRVIGAGLAVGALSGLVGAGGGFLVVPALALFGGLTMRRAIGTSLMVIALQSFAGFAGHVTHTHIDWPLTALVAGLAVVGSLAGARLAHLLSTAALRRGFAWFVLAMAVFMIGRQVSLPAAGVTAAVSLAVVLLVVRRRGPAPTGSESIHNPKVEQHV